MHATIDLGHPKEMGHPSGMGHPRDLGHPGRPVPVRRSRPAPGQRTRLSWLIGPVLALVLPAAGVAGWPRLLAATAALAWAAGSLVWAVLDPDGAAGTTAGVGQ
ncbi:MAG TPA: hypothetical protein VE990_08785 [Acidimicrobiales bacterium]|nr:hypothetical protein [Acidimicrobiales bacterium]